MHLSRKSRLKAGAEETIKRSSGQKTTHLSTSENSDAVFLTPLIFATEGAARFIVSSSLKSRRREKAEQDKNAACSSQFIRSALLAPRKEPMPHIIPMASSRFVLPVAFLPVMTFTPSANSNSLCR